MSKYSLIRACHRLAQTNNTEKEISVKINADALIFHTAICF